MLTSSLIRRFYKRVVVTADKLEKSAEIAEIQRQIGEKSRNNLQRSILTLGSGEGMKTIKVMEFLPSGAGGAPMTHFVSSDGLHVRWGSTQDHELLATENSAWNGLRTEVSQQQVIVDDKPKQEVNHDKGSDYMTHFISANVKPVVNRKKLLEKDPRFVPSPYMHMPYLRNESHIAKIPLSLHIILSEEIERISKEVSSIEAKYQSETLVLKGTVIADVKRDSMRCRLMLQRLERIQGVDIEKSVAQLPLSHVKETENLLASCRLCSKFMQIESRREALKSRVGRCLGVIDLLRAEYHTEKSHWLEWIIIWLILVEVVFGTRNLVNDLSKGN